MVSKKFLFHTMSVIALSLTLATTGYAADLTDVAPAPNEAIVTEKPVEASVEAPAAPATSSPDENISKNAATTTADTSTTTLEASQPTEGHAPVDEETTSANVVNEDKDTSDSSVANKDNTASVKLTDEAVVPTAGHAPVKSAAVEITTSENTQKQNTSTSTNSINTVPATQTNNNEAAAPSSGHAPTSTSTTDQDTAANNTTNKPVPTNQESVNATPKVVMIDPAPAPAPAPKPVLQATPVKGVSVNSYTVKKGDTLYLLAKRFVTSVLEIKSLNGLKSDWLYIGQILKVPNNAPVSKAGNSYTVKKGDTLYLLSKKYGTTVSTLKSLNGLKSTALYVGQVLKVPVSNTTATTSARLAAPTASRYDASRSEVLLLARLIYGESRGEPYDGQVAVGAVVLNRVKSALFPNTMAGVIYQKNEFSVVLDGQINMTPNTSAIKAAEAALSGYDPTGGALFYWNPVKAPNNSFLNAKPIIARIGSHVFAK